MIRVRLTARGRLALLYAGLVLVAGIMLSGLTYLLVQQGLKNRLVIGVRVGPNADRVLPPSPAELAEIGGRVRAETLSELLTQAAVALAVVMVIALVLGWLVAGRVLRPIRTIAATAGRLSAENLSERVPVNTPADELATLATTINQMLDRIQTGVTERDRVLDSQRMFAANAAHELRTPLTTMRTAIDVTLDGDPTKAELLAMADDIRTAITHSRRTLDGLLALARSQAGPVTGHPVDLADIAAGILDGTTDERARRDINVRSDLGPAATTGEPILLERMVGNLVDNAIRYNHTGGHITVTTGTAGAHAFLRVSNTGRTVASDEADRLLEPFVRGTGTRTRADGGAGLGLSIVRAVAVAHRGETTMTARPAGGLDIVVRLPARAPR
ncbi:two-component sensor histidine kinase [Microtetraspora sp. NBRC 13810]|uniref:sensor histidine kinase n=1 Tax=Microtetraspora sp. NBRC 13810 TaxID=3030990 RepID=UPI0024A1BAF7|nr:HAMP domain-containing sensor histidine kinase [Microtetraspora sp. NBRC 13810]GLW12678.1 two-component sensor histidine kinase [Microtetraspora sp. NBRC 13810]